MKQETFEAQEDPASEMERMEEKWKCYGCLLCWQDF